MEKITQQMEKIEEKPKRRISVHNLIEFVLREGDIDNRYSAGADVDAMQAGARMHRKLQARGGSSYTAEVPLKLTMDIECAQLTVEGRADGIIVGKLPSKWLTEDARQLVDELVAEDETVVTIEEIKCMYRNLHYVEKPESLHLAQAKCYAYIYARQQNKEKMLVQITYVDLDTEDIKRFWYVYSYVELEKWFVKMIWDYSRFVSFEIAHLQEFMMTAKELAFPYEYRKGQRELSAMVYSSMKRNERLFVQAPTGVGKTLSAIFPGIKAIGEGIAEKLFYLTAKTITRTVAEESFSLLKERGLHMKTLTIAAKDKLCILEERNCNPQSCERAKGHYDRINECLYELLTNEDNISRDIIEEYATSYRVCPYELALDAALWVDGVICDYNYLFDPKVQLKRFFSEQAAKGEYLFLIDEAHNLVERGRTMYSAVLYKEDMLQVKRLLTPLSKRAAKAAERLNKAMLLYRKELEEIESRYVILDECDTFYLHATRFSAEIDKLLEDQAELKNHNALMEFYFQVRHFMNMYEEMDENYVIYVEQTANNTCLHLFCVNPCNKLVNIMEKGKSTILFSATLLPIHYYKELLTGSKEDKAVYIPSPFEEENRFLAITSGVTSKYRDRNYELYERIVEYLRAAMVKKGNYMVFFSSYKMMQQVYDVAVERGLGEGRRMRIQEEHMTEEMREQFLQEFRRENDKPLLAFSILGGIFSEGIDLKEEQLIGAFIVGNGLPQVCVEREILQNYFTNQQMDGFAYAYIYPGMNKVLQAAGRVIRTNTDKGIILLMDDRFRYREYNSLFPQEWSNCGQVTLANVGTQIEQFWAKFEDS